MENNNQVIVKQDTNNVKSNIIYQGCINSKLELLLKLLGGGF